MLNAMTNFNDYEIFLHACCGNEHAATMLKQLTDYAHVMDDLTDRDLTVSIDHAMQVMWEYAVALPANPFYREHRAQIDALVAVAAANWKAATHIEREFENGLTDRLHVAYIIRSGYIDLVAYCAHVIGGPEWAAQVALKVRTINQDETPEAFKRNLEAEIAARKAGEH